LEGKDPDCREKEAASSPAPMVIDGVTVSKLLEAESWTVAPPAGAPWLSATVHELTPLGASVVGLQESDETVIAEGAIKLTVVFAELPL